MAGIGFILRRLTHEDDLLGVIAGYTHSALASTGPWLFTIFALASITVFSGYFLAIQDINEFRLIVIYNFSFSLVFTGPVAMVATRFVADMIYARDVHRAPGVLFGGLVVIYATQLPLVIWFYGFYADLEPAARLAAIVNYALIAGIWLIGIFLTALKAYMVVTRTYAIGMVVGIVAAGGLAPFLGVGGMLTGFSLGLATIMFALIARIFAEYPYKIRAPFAFLPRFKEYWELALTGLVYNAAIWIDKWVMWFSPHGEWAPSRLISFPLYDGAMFLAYLSIVPSMAVFVLSVETSFYERYLKFYQDIQQHANFRRIRLNQDRLIGTVVASLRNLVVLQASVCFLVILLAPTIFDWLQISFLQISIFRFGVLGAFFHVLLLCLSILIAYFDLRKEALLINVLFLVTNGVFSWATIELGYAYYGYGYFLSALTTFIAAALLLAFYINRLPYLTFIRNNTSI